MLWNSSGPGINIYPYLMICNSDSYYWNFINFKAIYGFVRVSLISWWPLYWSFWLFKARFSVMRRCFASMGGLLGAGMVDMRWGRCLRECRVHSPGEIGVHHQHICDHFDHLAHVSSLTSVLKCTICCYTYFQYFLVVSPLWHR